MRPFPLIISRSPPHNPVMRYPQDPRFTDAETEGQRLSFHERACWGWDPNSDGTSVRNVSPSAACSLGFLCPLSVYGFLILVSGFVWLSL